MQIAQRLLLVTTVICIVLAGCLYTQQNGKEKITDQWEKMCSEEFLHQVTMKQEVLLRAVNLFTSEKIILMCSTYSHPMTRFLRIPQTHSDLWALFQRLKMLLWFRAMTHRQQTSVRFLLFLLAI